MQIFRNERGCLGRGGGDWLGHGGELIANFRAGDFRRFSLAGKQANSPNQPLRYCLVLDKKKGAGVSPLLLPSWEISGSFDVPRSSKLVRGDTPKGWLCKATKISLLRAFLTGFLHHVLA